MASEAPDPRTFKTWEDAFQYPIPVVRKLEQQLRSNAGDNREKLRSLVGASYRDLLSTAETIIDMEERMSTVESNVARVGQNCNSRNLDRISRNAGKMHAHNRGRDVERYTFASQLAVLRSCPVVMARLMEKESGLLLPAKVLVIGRLVHKALSQSKHKAELVDSLRDKLGSLRRKLLRRIDKRLASAAGDVGTLIESMCAYSLATASTPTDVLRHFLHVRMERIIMSLRHDDGLKEHGIAALKLCLQTCQDTQSIFPRRLADALLKLKSQHLVQDPDVRALYELNLDVHERWIGDEARYYTPQPRYDELKRPEAEKLLHQWSKQAIPGFLKGMKTALEQMRELNEVAELRQELIETWIVSGSRMAGVKSKNVLDDLRDTMNGHLESIMRERAQRLKSVVDATEEALASRVKSDQLPITSLWSTTSTSTDLSNGAQAFKTNILNTYQGRDGTVLRIVSTYDKWMESVLEVKAIVKSMKEARWDDPSADEIDIEDSDDDFGDSKQILLSDDDPRLLEEVTRDALRETLDILGKKFANMVQTATHGEGDQVLGRIAFLLRVIRELGDRIPQLRVNERSKSLETPFTTELLIPLHTTLATQIVQSSVDAYRKRLRDARLSNLKNSILWEGNPPLPVQPSPTAFRFLQGLVKSMGAYGSDLWAPNGVQVLKRLAGEEITKMWREILEEPRTNGSNDEDAGEGATESETQETNISDDPKDKKQDDTKHSVGNNRQQQFKQLLFDILYIHRFLATQVTLGSPVSVVEEACKAAGVDEIGKTRLQDKASDYGRKTYLLFALLA